jgi:DUF4097 and DUF4098 domain-containing protein YvlB
MNTKISNVLRSESFEIDGPQVTVETVSDDVKILESPDGKCYIEISGGSENARELADLVEITTDGKNIWVKGGHRNKGFWRNITGHSHELNFVIKLPKRSSLKVKMVSADIEIAQGLENLKVDSVSGNISVSQNPRRLCEIKSVSGDIIARTFSACHYSLKTVSGDITVHVAPGLEIDIDGKSISGDMESEIDLDSNESSIVSNSEVVVIKATTISGNFVLARN